MPRRQEGEAAGIRHRWAFFSSLIEFDFARICVMLLQEAFGRVLKNIEEDTQGRKMAETVDEITIDWKDENGQQLVRQLKKEVLTSGAWSTIMFLYQDFDKKAGGWGLKKIRVVRYQKRGGKYIPQSKFNVSSAKQARQIIESLQNWLPEMDNQGSSEDSSGNGNVKS